MDVSDLPNIPGTQILPRKYSDLSLVPEATQRESASSGRYFVLDLDNDAHARRALAVYAQSCQFENPELARTLRQDWGISIEEQPAVVAWTNEDASIEPISAATKAARPDLYIHHYTRALTFCDQMLLEHYAPGCLSPILYAIGTDIFLERLPRKGGKFSWRVIDSSRRCLNRDLGWEVEPDVTALTDYQLLYSRYETREEAIETLAWYIKHRAAQADEGSGANT